jgi:hypothetical protein
MTSPVDVQGMPAPPDTKGFDHPSTAAAIRDILTRHIEKVGNSLNPPAKKGRVVSVDFTNYRAQVWFPSDTQSITVNLFPSTLPGIWDTKFSGSVSTSTQGIGSQVLVQSFFGSLYVTEILTGGQFASDWATSGNQTIALGATGAPEYVRGADYTFRTMWTGDGTLPKSGGPYAINIGPFTRNFAVDQRAGFSDQNDIWDGLFEVEVASPIGTNRYRFGTSLFDQAFMSGGNCFNGPPNGYGGSQDTWYKLLADYYQYENAPVGSVLNAHQYFDLAGVPNLYDWNNSADTQVTVTAVSTPIDTASFAVASMKMQSNVSHAVLKVAEGATTRYSVVPNASYLVSTRLYATVTTADSRIGIDWYDSANTLISTVASPLPTNLVATTWTSVFATFSAPVNAAYCNPYIQIAGTPATTTIFYCGIFQFSPNDMSSQSDYSLEIGMRQTIHGAPGVDVTTSPGEIWIRIYLDFLQFNNNSNNVPFVVRFKNLNSWNYPKSTKTGLVVFEYDTAPPLNNGILGYSDGNNPWSTTGTSYQFPTSAASTGPWRNPDLLIGQRGAAVLSHSSTGSTTSYISGFLKWSSQFEIAGIGRSRRGLNVGKAILPCPTSGTINVYPANIFTGSPFVTCTASGVPLAANQSLWWGIPPGVLAQSVPQKTYQNADARLVGGLFIVDNLACAGYWSPPEWAVLIAIVDSSGSTAKVNGQFVGGTVVLGDSGTTTTVPGALSVGNEVIGNVTVTTAVANTPISSTLSFTITGTGTENMLTSPNTNLMGVATGWNGLGSTSALVWLMRTTTGGTLISYRIYRAP